MAKANPAYNRKTGVKLTKEVREEFCRYIAEGNYVETAAALCGVCSQTIRDALRRGKNEGKGYKYQFYLDVKRAQAQAEASAVELIRAAGATDWRALAWYLQHSLSKQRWTEKRDKPQDNAPVKDPKQILDDVRAMLDSTFVDKDKENETTP